MPVAPPGEDVDDGVLNGLRHMRPLRRGLGRRMPRARRKQRHAATGNGAHVVLNRGVDVGRARGHGEAAREEIERLHLLLALPRRLDVLAHAIGELTRHHCHDDEQDEVGDVGGIGDADVVDRRIEEEGRGRQAGQPRDDRRRHTPARRSDDDGDQIAEGGVVQIEQRTGHEQRGSDRSDDQQRHGDRGNVGAIPLQSRQVQHAAPWRCRRINGLVQHLPHRLPQRLSRPCLRSVAVSTRAPAARKEYSRPDRIGTVQSIGPT
jgi:hypothetical protein